jgi:hypothetical protein
MASAEPIAVEVPSEDGGVRVEFDPERIRALGGGGDGWWRLAGELDPKQVSVLRVVCASFEDGHLLTVAATRPAGAAGHGEDSVRAALVDPEGSVVRMAEALLSTEYDSEGRPARIGLELYVDPGATPLRVAADRDEATPAGDAADDRATPLSFRMEGVTGAGRLELVTPS